MKFNLDTKTRHQVHITGMPVYDPKGLAVHSSKLYYADKVYDAIINIDLDTDSANFTRNNLHSVLQLQAYSDRHTQGKTDMSGL